MPELFAAQEAIERAKRWLTGDALPLWGTIGFDAVNGRFFDGLDLNGRPLQDAAQSVMLQGRQIYVYAHAALLGWYPPGRVLVRTAVQSMLKDFRGSERSAGFVYSITRDGRVADDLRDTSAHAFALLGLAWAYRLLGDNYLLDAADRTIAYLDGVLPAANGGGYAESIPATDALRRQRSHMHLFEAFMALDAAAPGRGYLDRATGIYNLFRTHFFEPKTHIVTEYMDAGLKPLPGERGQIFEPGHSFAWVWLLRAYAAAAEVNVDRFADALDAKALAAGFATNGAIYDEVFSGGTPHKHTHRLWPHAGAAKAAAAQHRAGRPGCARRAAAMLDVLMDRFAGGAAPGGWVDQTNASGWPLVQSIPASSLSHLVGAVAACDAVFGG